MFFASDNWAGVAPKINEALLDHSTDKMPAYGVSELDRQVEKQFSEIFERDVSVFFVVTGTAANSLALAANAKPGGIGFCHSEAHIIEDECGAPEFFSGNRLSKVMGENGKINLDNLKQTFDRFSTSDVHHGRPTLISITQASEVGTVYTLEQIGNISELAKAHDVSLHMDGARFSNALVSLGGTPAEMTWKQGVDYLSFGGTKNGCWCAEALISFDKKNAAEIEYLRKRTGHLLSKSRFIATQFQAYLKDDYWLELAAHANQLAARLANGLSSLNSCRIAFEVQTNEVFLVMKKSLAENLRNEGAKFYEWNVPSSHQNLLNEGEDLYRFVTSFATREDEIDAFLRTITSLSE